MSQDAQIPIEVDQIGDQCHGHCRSSNGHHELDGICGQAILADDPEHNAEVKDGRRTDQHGVEVLQTMKSPAKTTFILSRLKV